MRPKDIMDLRSDLAAKLSNPWFRETMALIIQSGSGITDYVNAAMFSDYATRSISSAENFFVIPEMSDLVQYSSKVLDSTDVADVTLAPSESGFAYFEKPIEMLDIRQSKILINAILWDRASDGTLVVHMWNDEYRCPDDAARYVDEEIERLSGVKKEKYLRWKEVRGRWGYAGVAIYRDGEFVGEENQPVSEEIARQYEDVEGVKAEDFTNPRRIVHAFFLLLSQTLVAKTIERGDKKFARRMKQMGVPNEVTVITFRRVDYDPKMTGEAKVEWSHRWLVRGFWRWQPYKNERGEWERKRIWINPFVKGPADKPLVITQKINAFVR